MISLAEARSLIAARILPLPAEPCALDEAGGRWLREEVRAQEDFPGFDRSSMDGYAVRCDDTSAKFRIIGETTPGQAPAAELGRGECLRIFTGSAVPPGQVRVVMQEDVRREGSEITIVEKDERTNIRTRGEDARAGQVLLRSGVKLGAGEIALLAQAGCMTVSVARQPRVLHLTTGGELVPPDQTPGPGQIRDSNSSLVAALLRDAGAALVQQTRCGDDPDALRAIIRDASEPWEVVLISGGASVGDYDFGARVLQAEGFEIVFAGLNLKPGKPLIFAVRGPQIAFVIPGNPVSHFVTFQVAIRAALERLLGLEPAWPLVSLELAGPLPATKESRETYWPALFLHRENMLVQPLQQQSSGDLGALVGVNALIQLQPPTPARAVGDRVKCLLLSLLLLASLAQAWAEPRVRTEGVPPARRNDAATDATFTLLDGELDGNGGGLGKLHDGILPSTQDDPAHNCFLRGGDGGRLLVDLGKAINIAQVNAYSWHVDVRAPQVWKLYASDGHAPGFEAQPKRPAGPASAGWKLLASVDTRPKSGRPGGQQAVGIENAGAPLGSYRYLLFDIQPTQPGNGQANTFFSEIDVIDASGPPAVAAAPVALEPYKIADGKYEALLDVSETPELADWARKDLMPVVQAWYPRIVELLPSEGYTAPKRFSITFEKERGGVAVTIGTQVYGAAKWYRENLKGEAIGSIVHELVHVVQQYRGRGARPGWLVEGIPDYLRFYLFEPQTHGADIPPRRAASARYDASYRQSANFLNWATAKYGKDLVPKLNAALRAGQYRDDLWKELTGHTAPELGEEWKASLQAAQ